MPVKLITMYAETRRYKNDRPVSCPICGGKLSHNKENKQWECVGLAYPEDDTLELQVCPYVFSEDDKTDTLSEEKKML